MFEFRYIISSFHYILQSLQEKILWEVTKHINMNLFNAQTSSLLPLKLRKQSNESLIEEFQVAHPGWYQPGSAF